MEKFVIYLEEWDIIRDLDGDSIKELMFALMDYVKCGEEKELDMKIRIAYRFMKAHIDRDMERYNEVVEKRREAGRKGAAVKHGKVYEKKTVRDDGCEELQREESSEREEDRDESPVNNSNQRVENEYDEPANISENEKISSNGNAEILDNIISGKMTGIRSLDSRFEDFWRQYPRNNGRERAERIYTNLNLNEEQHRALMRELQKDKRSKEWNEQGGVFIPEGHHWVLTKGHNIKLNNLETEKIS